MSMGVDLDAEVNDIVGVLNAQYAALVDRVVLLLADSRLWAGQGMTSMSAWVAWRTGVSTSTAKAIVAIAERVDELPISVAAFRRGELSLDQMATIARNAPGWTDAQSLGFGTIMTVAQLRRVLQKYPFPVLDEAGREIVEGPIGIEQPVDGSVESPAADAARSGESGTGVVSCGGAGSAVDEFVSFHQDDDGTFRLSGRLAADTGMVVQSALDEACDRLFQRGEFGAGFDAALVEMAQSSLDTVADPARRSRFKVNLFINADRDERGMVDATGWNVPDSIGRHITCDGTVTPIFLESGLPASVGRTQYVVPARTRTIIEHRDHGVCRVPGCETSVGLEVHHLIHWEHGGRTDTTNLVLICGTHHRQHHRDRLGITGDPDQADGLEFRNEHGRVIKASGASPNLPTGPPPKPASVYSHPDGGRMDTGQIYFAPPRTYFDDVRERVRSDAEYLARIQPPGLT